MEQFKLITSHWKDKAETHGKGQVSYMIGVWLSYYLETGVNLAKLK